MNEIITKVCSKCFKTKLLKEFYKQKYGKHGYRASCKECCKKAQKKRRLSAPEHDREYRLRNREKMKAYLCTYYRNAKENNPEQYRSYREKRKQKKHIYDIQYYSEGKRDEYFKKNKDERNRKRRECRKLHPEKYRRKNREYRRTRRARIKGNGGIFTETDWQDILKNYGSACLKCGSYENIEPDHVVPLAIGGTNYPDNIQPLCRSCNASKGIKTIDYRKGMDQLLLRE